LTRSILHVDLDAFYASVEQRDDPSLRGRPVLVGGHSRRGVVCAASYEARKFGCKSAMPMAEAMRRCPEAVVVSPRMSYYAEISSAFFDILGRFTPLVEGLSLDEAFLDVTGEERLFGDGPTIGRTIKQAVRDDLSLIASVGVAPNKFVAKIASDVGKPDGLCVVDNIDAFLTPLPLGRLWGVGPVAEASLARLGLKTIGDVRAAERAMLAASIGARAADHIAALAAGLDERAVEPDRSAKSVGHQDTFNEDLRSRTELERRLLDQLDRVCARLRRANLRTGSLTIRVKYADHHAVTRQARVEPATTDATALYAVARRLLAEVPDVERRGVRLTGVSAGALERRDAPAQLQLGDTDGPRREKLGDAIDAIADRFGNTALKRASLLDEDLEGPLRSSGALKPGRVGRDESSSESPPRSPPRGPARRGG
jgi:DNA polymerase-4